MKHPVWFQVHARATTTFWRQNLVGGTNQSRNRFYYTVVKCRKNLLRRMAEILVGSRVNEIRNHQTEETFPAYRRVTYIQPKVLKKYLVHS